jgi:hypothetical protein
MEADSERRPRDLLRPEAVGAGDARGAAVPTRWGATVSGAHHPPEHTGWTTQISELLPREEPALASIDHECGPVKYFCDADTGQ